MLRSTVRIATLVVLVIAAPARAQQVTAVTHAVLIDGNGGEPVPDAVVVIRGSVIEVLGPARSVLVPRNANVIDAHGRTLMPGLADMHVHLMGGWDGEHVDMLGYRRYLNSLLYAGVTTVLDMGNVLPYIQQLRHEIAAGRIPGPRIYLAGPVVDGPDPLWPPISYVVSSEAQLPSYVNQLKMARVDVVKAYVGLSERLLTSLVREASKESLRVFVHSWSLGSADVIRTGIAAFAHVDSPPISDEAVRLMRERGVASITTLATLESFSQRRLDKLAFLSAPLVAQVTPPQFLAALRTFAAKAPTPAESTARARGLVRLQTAMRNVKQLVDSEIVVAAGTDAPYPGVFLGEGMHRELELLVEAGLTPLQAISTATRNAALLMKDTTWGTIAVGKRADLLIINGDPAHHIADTRDIETVILRGQVLNRKELEFDPKSDPGFEIAGSIARE
ncbi:MAG: hypothetical protein E6H56_16590 [Betaproteobacteria bacterium]|nr:MAG: hypothetical protein E6H56_16590 [Betaproteobacteria bacterium]